MERYSFYQDAKCTIWTRAYFSITADSEAKATVKAVQIAHTDLFAAETSDSHIEIMESETLYDTLEELSVEDNGGMATIEVFRTVAKKNTCQSVPYFY